MGRRSSYQFPFASYPAVRIALLFAAGIITARFTSIPMIFWGILFGMSLLLFLLSNYFLGKTTNINLYKISVILYLSLLVSFGSLWYRLHSSDAAPPSQELLEAYKWETVHFKGKLLSRRQSSTGNLQLDIETDTTRFSDSLSWYEKYKLRAVLDPRDTKIPGKLALGNRIYFSAVVYPLEGKRNPYQFDYKQHLESQDIYNQAGIDTIYMISSPPGQNVSWTALRQSTLELIEHNFSNRSSMLAKALLIGYKNELPQRRKTDFSRAGLSHIMAVSGLHVGFLIAPFWVLIPFFWSLKYGRHLGFLILIAMLLFYAGLTGFSASVTRASITGGFIMYGRLFNKIRNIANLTAVSASIILLADPTELFQIGFQLSFSAVYIIILIIPVINKRLPVWIRYRWQGKIIMVMLVSLVVQAGLFPLLSYYFGELSIIGPLTNAVAIPMLTVIVPFALFLLVISSIFPALGAILNMPNEWGLIKLNEFVSLASSWDASWIQLHLNDPLVFLLWLAVIIGIASTDIASYRWKIACLILVLASIQQLVQISKKSKTASLEIVIFDVGQGDAALIKTPYKRHFLIDTGIWKPGYNSGRSVIIPHLKAARIPKIDAVFLSHPHADHIGGMPELIENIPIDTIYNSGYRYNSNLYRNYLRKAAERNIPLKSLQAGDTVSLDQSIQLLVYGPRQPATGTEPNEHSLILELVYGTTQFLFAGDSGKEQELRLLNDYGDLLDTDILKVGHHGSKTSSSKRFLTEVSPRISVVSLAKANRFGHPHKETVERLVESGSELKFTSIEKAVIFRSDGHSIRQIDW